VVLAGGKSVVRVMKQHRGRIWGLHRERCRWEDQLACIACIGARDVAPDVAAACREIGARLARAGYEIVTGATPGTPGQHDWAGWADAAFAAGTCLVRPASLMVCLPWRHFPHGSSGPPEGVVAEYVEEHPEWIEAAQAYWDATSAGQEQPWRTLRRTTRLRQARNAGIVLHAQLVLAWPSEAAEGTRFAMGFAEARSIPVIDLAQTDWRVVLAALEERASRRQGGA